MSRRLGQESEASDLSGKMRGLPLRREKIRALYSHRHCYESHRTQRVGLPWTCGNNNDFLTRVAFNKRVSETCEVNIRFD